MRAFPRPPPPPTLPLPASAPPRPRPPAAPPAARARTHASLTRSLTPTSAASLFAGRRALRRAAGAAHPPLRWHLSASWSDDASAPTRRCYSKRQQTAWLCHTAAYNAAETAKAAAGRNRAGFLRAARPWPPIRSRGLRRACRAALAPPFPAPIASHTCSRALHARSFLPALALSSTGPPQDINALTHW